MTDGLPLQYVKGIGPRRADALANEGIRTLDDVVMNVPRAYIDRKAAPSIRSIIRDMMLGKSGSADTGSLNIQTEIAIVVHVVGQQKRTVGKGRGKTLLSVSVADGSGATAELVYWNLVDYHARQLADGKVVVVSGKPEYNAQFGTLQFHHPEIETVDDEDLREYQAGGILPKYAMTQGMRNVGITMRTLRNLALHALENYQALATDPLPARLCATMALPERTAALRELHSPTAIERLESARKRMKFEELFFFQLLLAARAQSRKTPERGIAMNPRSPRARSLVESLPYELTRAQRRVIHEIVADMSDGTPMNRLLQGDVGSGKTIVALLCLLNAIDNGYQTVLMAPTEILAEQHTKGIERFLEGTDVVVTQLVGGQRKSLRAKVAQQIQSGEANIIVGTHALFEADVAYHKLGLIVIDEQHRFGVAQRAALHTMARDSHGDTKRTPHVLVMSATPIPRTLSMTVYGDLDVSVIDELPAHRKPILTHLAFESKLPEVHQFIRDEVRSGRQAYIVYPLVEVSEKLDLKSAVEHHAALQQHVFPDLKVGLIHGQMLWYEKEDAMRSFLNKDFDILVATTVVEVGIDVPNATVMLIENAERFGLSQLHQLRGRVGRGQHQSHCFLATKDHFKYATKVKGGIDDASSAAARLQTMVATTDGFKIAEVDLQLRGPGDVMGKRQSGLPEFRFANLATDGPIIERARSSAISLLASDPRLALPEHAATRDYLVALFEDAAPWMTVA